MMELTRAVVLAALAMAVGTGCGNTKWLLAADFDGLEGSPHGSIPGQPPSDDSITVGDGSPAWPKMSGDRLIFPTNSWPTRFKTATVEESDSKRTISWDGQLSGNQSSPSFNFHIGGYQPNVAGPEFPLTLKLFGKHAELRAHNNSLLNGPSPFPDTTASWTHVGTIILRLDQGTYTVIIKNSVPNAPSIDWSGSIPAATLDELRNKPRMEIKMAYSTGTNAQYHLNKITIKENY